MMGHRGVRIGITYPEVSHMQFKAIFTATAQLLKEGLNPLPEIMIPVTISAKELDFQKAICDKALAEVEAAEGVKVNYLYGTMIEIPALQSSHRRWPSLRNSSHLAPMT